MGATRWLPGKTASHIGSVLTSATRVPVLPVVICYMSSPLPPILSTLSHSIIKHKNAKKRLKKRRGV